MEHVLDLIIAAQLAQGSSPKSFVNSTAELAQLQQLRQLRFQPPASEQPQPQPQSQLGQSFQQNPAGFCTYYLQPCFNAFKQLMLGQFKSDSARVAALALRTLPGVEWHPAAVCAIQHMRPGRVGL